METALKKLALSLQEQAQERMEKQPGESRRCSLVGINKLGVAKPQYMERMQLEDLRALTLLLKNHAVQHGLANFNKRLVIAWSNH